MNYENRLSRQPELQESLRSIAQELKRQNDLKIAELLMQAGNDYSYLNQIIARIKLIKTE